ncbi:hypothetical protein [Bailinhaonella thermotolerans]|uniref:Metallopeptidase domain-containing protein n=1 Tax=Bailinhaonella thermotolerans TaxID=1070861 RepID=A0A3A4ARJ5_9ACTN|nr:hypothetical protein [Bailinhaonella thermotolerans]RJL23908.1 hypothetical protein D5H75_31200 [Bailinhaonella thermotolerans]
MAGNPDFARLRAQLLAHEPVPPRALVDKVRPRVEEARRHFGAGRAILARELANVTTMVYTSAVPTLAVCMTGDYHRLLLVNPWFAESLDAYGLSFGLTHEGYHLLFAHLSMDTAGDELRTLAQEIVINHLCLRRSAQPDPHTGSIRPGLMPIRTLPGGRVETVGIDPNEQYMRYAAQLRDAGMTPVPYETFVRDELTCRAELARMPNPPGSAPQVCAHHAQDGSGDGFPGHVLDRDHLRDAVEAAVRGAVHDAVHRDDQRAREELEEVMGVTAGQEAAGRLWGLTGAGRLRGDTAAGGDTQMWKTYLATALHARCVPGARLVWNQKRPWDLQMSWRGDELKRKVLIAVDASGSMETRVLNWIAEHIGEGRDDLILEWLAFDTEAYPFRPGEPLRGGGGTDVKAVSDYVDDKTGDEGYDAILVVTDGYFASPDGGAWPRDPDRWILLITPGGTTSRHQDHFHTVLEVDMPES